MAPLSHDAKKGMVAILHSIRTLISNIKQAYRGGSSTSVISPSGQRAVVLISRDLGGKT